MSELKAERVADSDPPIRVLVADDHPPTRAGVRSSLEEGGFLVVAEASTADSAVAEAVRTRPDVCLLDVRMPGGGVTAAARITQLLPSTTVLMLTVSEAREDLLAALRAGATGYLLKSIDPDRLGAAVHGALTGEASIPRSLVTLMVEEFKDADPSPRIRGPRGQHLTRRESEVIGLLNLGLSTAQIAGKLFVEPATVRSHISSALRKMGSPDRRSALGDRAVARRSH